MDRPQTDEELMVAYARGDAGAFDALYERYSRRVYGFLRPRLPNSAERDEVFQAVFLKLHRTREKFDAKFRFAPWIFLICRSVLVDAARTRQVYRPETDVIDEENVTDPISEAAPEVGAIDLAGVAPADRQLLEWRYFETMPFEEMAQRLGTGPATVRKRVSRAVRRLRILLKGEKS